MGCLRTSCTGTSPAVDDDDVVVVVASVTDLHCSRKVVGRDEVNLTEVDKAF